MRQFTPQQIIEILSRKMAPEVARESFATSLEKLGMAAQREFSDDDLFQITIQVACDTMRTLGPTLRGEPKTR